jgi:hypothetical protein
MFTHPHHRLASIVFLASFFISGQIRAQSVTSSGPAKKATVNCLLCDWTVAPEISKSTETNSCEDLMLSACIDKAGEYKTKETFDRIERHLKNLVKEAQNKASQALGFSTLEAMLKKKLKDEGLAVRKDLSEKARKYVFDSSLKGYVSKELIYEAVAECDAEAKQLQNVKYYSIDDPLKLQEHLANINAFKTKTRTLIAEHLSKDLPGLLNKMGTVCGEIEDKKDEIQEKDLAKDSTIIKIKSICGQKRQLRDHAIRLYLKKESTESQNEISKFVESNLDLILFSSYSLKNTFTLNVADENTDIVKLRELIGESQTYDTCSKLSDRFEGRPREVVQETNLLISKSRIVVEYLIGHIFTPERHEKAKNIFSRVRQAAVAVAEKITNDPKKIAKIKDNYQRIGLTWLEKPAESKYKLDSKTGIEILNTDKSNGLDKLETAFTDSLSFFTTLNAFYIPDMRMGATDIPLSVTMMPVFIELMDENPYGYTSVLAHEAGHNIGPRVSVINGYDLRDEYEPLLKCLRSSDSIRMQENQADENVADTISAEIMTKLISDLPKVRREAAVLASMQPFCKMNLMSDETLAVDMTESHSEASLRLSGIFGSNKSLRELLSCKGDSRQFKTCSLKGGL